jgi:hypothetical protein
LTTKLGRCHPNVCTAETGSQLLTATSYILEINHCFVLIRNAVILKTV